MRTGTPRFARCSPAGRTASLVPGAVVVSPRGWTVPWLTTAARQPPAPVAPTRRASNPSVATSTETWLAPGTTALFGPTKVTSGSTRFNWGTSCAAGGKGPPEALKRLLAEMAPSVTCCAVNAAGTLVPDEGSVTVRFCSPAPGGLTTVRLVGDTTSTAVAADVPKATVSPTVNPVPPTVTVVPPPGGPLFGDTEVTVGAIPWLVAEAIPVPHRAPTSITGATAFTTAPPPRPSGRGIPLGAGGGSLRAVRGR
jgi:hypothetical protein